MSKIKILCIDGGGSKGAISLSFLLEIEKRIGKSIADVFDLFVGTSAGSIIVSSLILKNEDGTCRFSNCQEILDTFIDSIDKIFYRSWGHLFKTLGGLIGPRYESESEYKVLYDIFKENIVTDNLIITSNVIDPTIRYFEINNDTKLRIVDAIMASSAAPTYYGVHTINYNSINTDFVDGGISANNPSMAGYAEAIKRGFKNDEIILVSIGAGYCTLPEKDMCDEGGLLQWAAPISKNMMATVADFVDFQLYKMLPHENYFRLNMPIMDKKMDIVDKTLLYNMVNSVKDYIDYNIEINNKITDLCKKLI